MPDEDCYILRFVQEKKDPDTKETRLKEYQFKFYKRVRGILPELVSRLIKGRKKVKAQIAALKNKDRSKDDDLLMVLDKKQLCLKVSANSFYGVLGVQSGAKLPLVEGAMSITGIGRNMLLETKQRASMLYGAVVVYGDTDSLMLQIPGITHLSQCNYWGKKLEGDISGIPPGGKDVDGVVYPEGKPGWYDTESSSVNMEYEKSMRLLCLTKKRYSYLIIGPDGNFVVDKDRSTAQQIKYKICNKGGVLSRRDNCQFVKEVYTEVLDMVLNRKSVYDALDYLMHVVELLIMGYVPCSQLLITKCLGSNYTSDSATMKVFADGLRDKDIDVKAGERLPYYVLLNGKKAIGEKMELQDCYREDPHQFPIDYLYYLNNLLKNPLDQLFAIGFADQLHTLGNTELKKSRRRKVVTLKTPIALFAW